MISGWGPTGVMGNQEGLESGHMPDLICLLPPWSERELVQGWGHRNTSGILRCRQPTGPRPNQVFLPQSWLGAPEPQTRPVLTEPQGVSPTPPAVVWANCSNPLFGRKMVSFGPTDLLSKPWPCPRAPRQLVKEWTGEEESGTNQLCGFHLYTFTQ